MQKIYLFLFLFISVSFCYAQASFTISPSSGEGCAPLVLNCFDTSTGASTYTWTITGTGMPPEGSVDASPGFTFLNPGTYTVTQTINIGTPNESSTSETITVFALPEAEFAADVTSGCAPITVAFEDLSTSPNSTIVSWEWDLGQPPIRTVQDPVEIYTDNNTFDIDLVVTDANGCQNVQSKSDYITVFANPIAEFTADITSGCAPISVQFADLSTSPSSTIVSWEWDLGQPPIRTTQNPSGTYTDNNTYDIDLIVTDANGCQNVETKVNYITSIKPPKPSFLLSSSQSCKTPFTLDITNTTNSISGVNYNWSFFGNGVSPAVSNTEDPGSVTYNQAGSFDISLTTNIGSCTNDTTATNALTIKNFMADFSLSDTILYLNQLVEFTANTNEPNSAYKWYINDTLLNDVSSTISTSFDSEGSKIISLVATDGDNICSDSIVKTVMVMDSTTVGLKNNFFNKSDLLLYPNPLSTQTTLALKTNINFEYDVVITSLSGKEVRNYQNNSERQLVIYRGSLYEGVYFVSIFKSDGYQLLGTKKLIVK